MCISDILKGRTLRNLLLVPFLFIYSTTFALSSMGTATIINSNGTPCFSIPKNSETKNGLPLYSLTVSEIRPGNLEELSPSVWSFETKNHKAPPTILPTQCIRYGDNPAGTTRLTLMPMKPNTLYYVSIRAQNNVSNVFAYTGIFCIKLKLSKGFFVQVISGDRSLGEARFAACFN